MVPRFRVGLLVSKRLLMILQMSGQRHSQSA
jgi:hypothetical protein